MAEIVKFTATKLATTGKKGILKPDATGAYTIVLGGLNVYNSAKEYYPGAGATDLFEKSSIFQRRVANGCLKAELGHPKRLPGMSDDAFINRILSIYEDCVCAAIVEVWLDFNYGKNNPQFNNPNLIAIMGRVKPAGPHAAVLKSSLDDPEQNVCFSIRALTRDFQANGRVNRVLQTIVSWDMVNEPGIHIANKWDTPTMEAFGVETIEENLFSARSLSMAANRIMSSPIAMESDRMLAGEVLGRFASYGKHSQQRFGASW